MLEKTLDWFIREHLSLYKINGICETLGGVSNHTLIEWRKQPLMKRTADQLKKLGGLANIEIKMEKKDANS